MKKTRIIRSVYPVYAVALVIVLLTFTVGLHSVRAWAAALLLSGIVYAVLRHFFPDTTVVEEVPEPEPTDPKEAELFHLRQDRDNAVSELRQLNEAIPDETLSAHIAHIEQTTAQIVDYVVEHPEQKGQIRRFMDYYLPTTLRLMQEYARLEGLHTSGENIDAAKSRIEATLATACAAFDKQLDALYADTTMDVSAESAVMEAMLQQDGLLRNDF